MAKTQGDGTGAGGSAGLENAVVVGDAENLPHEEPARQIVEVALDRIRDGGAQAREEMSVVTVGEYAEALLNGATFPPVILFDDGTDLWLADGFHRVEAHRKVERKVICAEIRKGTARDAILHGMGANAFHGLRRTQADRRRAIERLLTDPEWARWSNRKIAEVVNVDHKTVGAVRRQLTGEIPQARPAKSKTGESPQTVHEEGRRTSLVSDLLRTVPDAAIVAECRRRGLTVTA